MWHHKRIKHIQIKLKYCRGVLKRIIPIIVKKYVFQENPNQIIKIFNYIHHKLQKRFSEEDENEEDPNEDSIHMIKEGNLKFDSIVYL